MLTFAKLFQFHRQLHLLIVNISIALCIVQEHFLENKKFPCLKLHVISPGTEFLMHSL